MVMVLHGFRGVPVTFQGWRFTGISDAPIDDEVGDLSRRDVALLARIADRLACALNGRSADEVRP
jgi:hypothetical protein